MSGSTSVVTVLALACLVTMASAQTRSPQFGAGLGLTAPQGGFKADPSGAGFNVGWEGIAFVEFRALRMPIALRLDAIFGENPANVRLRNDIGSGYSLKMRTFGANADMVYKFRWSSRGGEGYLLGGIGYCTASLLLSFGESSGGAGDNKFAWNAGGGLIFPIARVAMFLELRYYNVATAFDFAKLPFVALTTGVRWGRKAA